MHPAGILSHCASYPGPLIPPGAPYCTAHIIPLCMSSHQASYPTMRILSPPSILSHYAHLILLCILSYYAHLGHVIPPSIFSKCAYHLPAHLITHFISSGMSSHRTYYHSSAQYIPLRILSYYAYLIPLGILSDRAFYSTGHLIPVCILSQRASYPTMHTSSHRAFYPNTVESGFWR